MQRFALASLLLASLAGLSSAQYPTPVEVPAHTSQPLPATLTPTAPALLPVSSHPEAAWTSLVAETSTVPTPVASSPGYPIASSIPAADATSLIPSSSQTFMYVPTAIATASGYARPSAWGNASSSGLPPVMTGAASKGRGSGMGSLGALVGICLVGLVL